MAYDELTAERFRDALVHVGPIIEKRMMGGLCFMLGGHMIGGADKSKDGTRRFMFRIGKDNQDKGLSMPGAEPMVQGERLIRGFFFVEEEKLDDTDLRDWVALAVGYVKSLPPK